MISLSLSFCLSGPPVPPSLCVLRLYVTVTTPDYKGKLTSFAFWGNWRSGTMHDDIFAKQHLYWLNVFHTAHVLLNRSGVITLAAETFSWSQICIRNIRYSVHTWWHSFSHKMACPSLWNTLSICKCMQCKKNAKKGALYKNTSPLTVVVKEEP